MTAGLGLASACGRGDIGSPDLPGGEAGSTGVQTLDGGLLDVSEDRDAGADAGALDSARVDGGGANATDAESQASGDASDDAGDDPGDDAGDDRGRDAGPFDAVDLDGGTGGPPDAAEPLVPGSHTVSAQAGGFDRAILVYVPNGWKVGDSAAVALHGNGDSANNFLVSMGLRASADARGVALALPRAMSGHYQGLDWDAYTQPTSRNPDIAVVEAAHALLAAGGADPDRIYLLGYSQGGFLSYRVAMERPLMFAAAHVSGASCPLPGYGLEEDAARRIPMDLLIGTRDSLLSNARDSRALLERLGFEVRYAELAGVGHCCPLQNRATDVLDWFLDHTL